VSGHFWRTQNSSALLLRAFQAPKVVRTYVRPSTILIFRIWIRWNFFSRVWKYSIESLSKGRLKRFEFYADFAKLKRRLRSFRLKRFEVYANFARLSTLMSVKFVVAKHSSQTLRGVRQLCEALNSNKKFHNEQFGTLRVYVINAKFSALNFTSMKVANLSSQTLRKSSSFRTLRRLHDIHKCEVRGCDAFDSNASRSTRTLRGSQL
jgi:hypothetical protein